MQENLYQLKETFLQEWPLPRIQNMTLEEYTNLDKTSFCYWLEAKTHDLGSIWGGSSYKFGIYKRRDISTTITVDNRITDGEYAWFQKYGATKEAAFQTVKNTIVSIIQNVQNNTLENIDAIDLGDAYKWKIAFMYGNFNVVNIFKNESLLEAAQSLGYTEAIKNYSNLNRFILSNKSSEQDYFDYTAELWKQTSLANSFSEIIENFKSYLEFSETKIHDFTFNEKKKGKNWIWISDTENIIGKDGFCHYEIIIRPKHPKKLWIEIHFEHKKSRQDLYKNLLNNKLSEQFFWNKDHGAGELSLTYFEAIEFNDSKINEKIEQALLKLDETFGNTLRNYALQIDNKKRTILNMPLNQILYGPPGTGKTYNSINKAIEIINPTFDLTQDRETVKKEFDRLVAEGQIVFTTFHQSMAYEDFIEGIKPIIDDSDDENKQVLYEVVDGLFKQIIGRAKEQKKETIETSISNNFDETWERLIELVKLKISNNELLKIGSWEYGLSNKDSLKYSSLNSPSKYTFTITKQNILDVYQNKKARPSGAFQKDMQDIVDFMKNKFQLVDYKENNSEEIVVNNNDKYVLIIDEINRGNVSQIFGELITLIEESKRLGKEEELEIILPYSKKKFGVPSNIYIIGTMNTADRSVEALDTALRRRFSFVEMMPNEKIVDSLKFTDTFDRKGIMQKINQRIEVLLDRNYTLGHSYFIKEDFKNSFENEIIPLLQEYFYNDYGKIGLVLGRGFVREKAITAKNDKSIFADFDTKNEVDINKSYELIPFADINFDEAIQILLV